jgi:hypothetical protein
LKKVLIFALLLIISTLGTIEAYAEGYPDGLGFACVRYFSSWADLEDWSIGQPLELEKPFYISYDLVGEPVEIKFCTYPYFPDGKLPEGDFYVSHVQTVYVSLVNIRRIPDPKCPYLVTRRFLSGTRGAVDSGEICTKFFSNKNFSIADGDCNNK